MRVNYLARTLFAAGLLSAGNLFGGSGTLAADTYVNSASPSSNFGTATVINVNSTSSGLFLFNFTPAISRTAPARRRAIALACAA